jgi:hypothetical protein
LYFSGSCIPTNELMNLNPGQTRMRVDESCNSRSRLSTNSHQLPFGLINSDWLWTRSKLFWWELVRVFAIVRKYPVNSHATLVQLFLLLDQGMRVEKTLMQTLASWLSSTLILVCPGL